VSENPDVLDWGGDRSYTYHHRAQVDPRSVEMAHEFKRPSQEWRLLGEEIVMEDALYPPDWAIIKAIQQFESGLWPMVVKTAFSAPSGGEVMFHRHGLVRFVTDLRRKYAPIKMLLPTKPTPCGTPVGVPIFNTIFRDEAAEEVAPGIPIKPYMGYSWDMVDIIKRQWWECERQLYADNDAKWAEMTASAERENRLSTQHGQAAKLDEEADYTFDEHWKRRNLKSEIRDISSAEWNALGAAKGNQ